MKADRMDPGYIYIIIDMYIDIHGLYFTVFYRRDSDKHS